MSRSPHNRTPAYRIQQLIGEAARRLTVTSVDELSGQPASNFDAQVVITDLRYFTDLGGVSISGIIHKQLYYLDGHKQVNRVAGDIAFQKFIEIDAATPEMHCSVRLEVVDVQAKLIRGGGAAETVIILAINARVGKTETIALYRGGDLLQLESTVGEAMHKEFLQPVISLHVPAAAVMRVVAAVGDSVVEIDNDGGVVRGVVLAHIFFTDEDRMVRHQAARVPFKAAVALPGARPGMNLRLHTAAFVADYRLDIAGRELNLNLQLILSLKISETLQIEPPAAPEWAPAGRKQNIVVQRKVAGLVLQEAVRSEVVLPEKVSRVFEVFGRLQDTHVKIIDGQVVVAASLQKQIFYADTQERFCSFREEVPVRLAGAAPGGRPGMNHDTQLRIVGEIDFRLADSETIEQTAIIEALVTLSEYREIEVITGVAAPEAAGSGPKQHNLRPRVYIVQPGDTMLLIARRFALSYEALIGANPQIDPGGIAAGQRIFVPL